eukprot:2676967-Prorocentrum_lima.AAC.1
MCIRDSLGDTNVGKTRMAIRFAKGEFHQCVEPSIGANLFTRALEIDNDIVNIEMRDIAGQGHYKSLAPMYSRGAP